MAFEPLKKIFGHTIVYALGIVASQAVGFVMIPVYTRCLAVADYGILEVLTRTGSVLSLLLLMGMGMAVLRLYAECSSEREQAEVVGTAVAFCGITSVVAGLAFLLGSGGLAQLVLRTRAHAFLIQLLVVGTMLEMTLVVPLAVIRARDRSKLYVAVTLGRLFCSLCLNVWFVVGLKLGVPGILISTIITGTGVAVAVLIIVARETGFGFSWTKMKALLRFGLPFVPSGVLMLVLHYADRFLIMRLCENGEEVVGVYGLGYRLGMTLGLLVTQPFTLGLSSSVFKIADREDALHVYGRIMTYYVAFASFFALGMSLVADDVLRIIAPSAYHVAGRVVPPILLGYACYGIYNLLQIGIQLKKRTHLVPLFAAVGAVTNIGLNLWLLPRLGMIGAAYATVGAFAAMATLTYFVSKAVYPIPYEFHRIVKCAVTAVAVYALGRQIVVDQAFLSLCWRGLAALTFPLVLYVGRFYLVEEIGRVTHVASVILARLHGRPAPVS